MYQQGKIMKLPDEPDNDRAVSPVIGVALLIAVAVILAAVIGAVVLGVGTGGAEVPQATLTADNDSNELVLSHDGGEPLVADQIRVEVNGSNTFRLNNEFTGGDSFTTGDEVTIGTGLGSAANVTVFWEDPESDAEHIIEDFNEPEI